MHSVDRNIVTLRADDGSVFLAMMACACSFAPFFSGLFSASPCDPAAQADLLPSISEKFSPTQRADCEGLLIQSAFCRPAGHCSWQDPWL